MFPDWRTSKPRRDIASFLETTGREMRMSADHDDRMRSWEPRDRKATDTKAWCGCCMTGGRATVVVPRLEPSAVPEQLGGVVEAPQLPLRATSQCKMRAKPGRARPWKGIAGPRPDRGVQVQRREGQPIRTSCRVQYEMKFPMCMHVASSVLMISTYEDVVRGLASNFHGPTHGEIGVASRQMERMMVRH